jgi:hypothetical protein
MSQLTAVGADHGTGGVSTMLRRAVVSCAPALRGFRVYVDVENACGARLYGMCSGSGMCANVVLTSAHG